MITEKENIKKIREDFTETGRDIWLAGLGLFSAVETEGQKLFDKFVDKGKEMIEKGEAVEKKSKDYGSEKKSEFTDRVEDGVKFVEGKLNSVLETIGISSHHEVQELTEKVDKLTELVAGLAHKLDDSLKTGAKAKGKTRS